jgi:hypothetical protein
MTCRHSRLSCEQHKFAQLLTVPLLQTKSTVGKGTLKFKSQSQGKSKVISNKGDGVAAQQFQLRLGKNTTVPLTLGFTKSNELFVGRLAMLGFAAACIGEVVTGQGCAPQPSCACCCDAVSFLAMSIADAISLMSLIQQ